MNIAPSEKFSCFAYSGFALSEDLPDELRLGPRIWFTRSLGFEISEHWQGWLGELQVKAMSGSNCILYMTMPSRTPEILDGENRALDEAMNYILHALVVQGTPHFEKGVLLNGANIGGEINVRQFSEHESFLRPEGMDRFRVAEPEFRRAVTLADRLRQVNEGRENWARLRRGIKALWTATRLGGGDRLHQCVRALESLVKPETAKSRKHFAHRIDQTFTTANAETRDTLHQIYDMRSHVEHVHQVLDALPGNHATRIAVATRRTRQVDALARFALARVLEDDGLFEAFRTEAGIDGFWKLDDASRVAKWGSRLELTAIK